MVYFHLIQKEKSEMRIRKETDSLDKEEIEVLPEPESDEFHDDYDHAV